MIQHGFDPDAIPSTHVPQPVPGSDYKSERLRKLVDPTRVLVEDTIRQLDRLDEVMPPEPPKYRLEYEGLNPDLGA